MHFFTVLWIMELLSGVEHTLITWISYSRNYMLKIINNYNFEVSNYPLNIKQLFCLYAFVDHYNEPKINMTHLLVEKFEFLLSWEWVYCGNKII